MAGTLIRNESLTYRPAEGFTTVKYSATLDEGALRRLVIKASKNKLHKAVAGPLTVFARVVPNE